MSAEQLDTRRADADAEAEADKLDRTLKLSSAETQRRLSHDYAGDLLRKVKPLPPIPRPEPGDIILGVGITGTGKSTAAKALVASWASARIVVWDHEDEWSIFGRQTDFVDLGDLTRRMTIDDFVEQPEVLQQPELRLAVVPTGRGADGRGADFADFLEVLGVDELERESEDVENRGLLPYTLVLEELPRVAPYAVGQLNELACVGRHGGLSVMALAQWANAIPHPLRRQCRRIFAGAQTWDLDLDALRQPMRDQPELVESISQLPNHQFAVWDRDAARRGSSPPPRAAHTKEQHHG